MTDQLYLSDDMQPAPEVHIPEIADAINAELAAIEEAREASQRKKAALDTTTRLLLEHKLERQSYVDPRTGKKRWRIADTTARAKSIAAVSREDKPKRRRKEVEIGEEVAPIDRLARGLERVFGSTPGDRVDAADAALDAFVDGVDKARKRRSREQLDAERVESRRVPRATVEREIDPFGGVRQAMEAEVVAPKPRKGRKSK